MSTKQLTFEKIMNEVRRVLAKQNRPMYPAEIAAKLSSFPWLAEDIRDAVFGLWNKGEVELTAESQVRLVR